MPILWLAGRMGQKTMEAPPALALVAGERVAGELFVNTRDVRIRGFQWVGTGLEGKLVLTTYRLFYCFYDEKSVAFAIEPRDVDKVEHVPAHAFFPRPPRILLTCRLPGATSSRLCTFGVPASVGIQEPAGLGMMRQVSYTNPGTAADFAESLQTWKATGGAADDAARRDIAEQRRQLVEASILTDARNAILRLVVALPCALLTLIAPIFGTLALREARRLRERAHCEGVPVPDRLIWVSRLGVAWIVLGTALWAFWIFVSIHGPLV